jgi:hypothetical protein
VAWYRPLQVLPTGADLDDWVTLYTLTAESMFQGTDVEVKSKEIGKRHGHPSVEVDVAFDAGKNKGVRLLGTTVVAEGASFHVAVVGHSSKRGVARKRLDKIIEGLEIRSPYPDGGFGGQIAAGEMLTTELTEYWREPLAGEKDLTLARAKDLGLATLSGCWAAIHPRGPFKPDIAATCAVDHRLGPVDTYSFGDEQQALKEKLFGSTPVPDAEMLELGDRTGFLFKPDAGELALFVAIAAHGDGLTRTFVLGPKSEAARLEEEARALMSATNWATVPEFKPGQWAAYYVSYKPWHPFVWGPVCCSLGALGGIGALVLFGLRRQGSGYDDLDNM